MQEGVCVKKRKKMVVDVWAGVKEVAGKVSLCHLFLPTQAEKPDTAPGPNWSRCLPFSRRWPSKAWVSLHLLLCQHREVWHITPTPTPQGYVWKAAPKLKHETKEIFLRWERKLVEERDHQSTSNWPTNWKEERMKGRLESSAILHCLSHPTINWTLIKPLEKLLFPVFFTL